MPFLEVSDAARERGIALSSASKTFNLAGLVCAVIAAGSDTAWAELERLPLLDRHPGHLGVLGSVAAFSDPASDAWLDGVIELLDGNRRLLGELLGEHLPEARWTPPGGRLSELDRPERLRARPRPGAGAARARPDRGQPRDRSSATGGEGFVRLNVGTSPELVTEAVARIAKAVA